MSCSAATIVSPYIPLLSSLLSVTLALAPSPPLPTYITTSWQVISSGEIVLISLSSQPYRPPDPSALPPMPFGLPFIARPGQEGFDQYGRMLPPELPEGWDGWGRPLVGAGANAQPAPPVPATAQSAPAGNAQSQMVPLTGSRSSSSGTSTTGTGSGGTGRPDQYVGWRNYYLLSAKSDPVDPRGWEVIPEEKVKKRLK
nr:uncharacterized protein CI109_002732 [Kwoniella shandongensis]KAA5528975.1 hypothetical protein CI109_002732 [Kwoniella shandongensis]